MDIWLIYIVKTLLLPQSSLLLLTAVGGILLARGRKVGASLLLISLMAWYLLSIPFVAKALARSLESYPALTLIQLDDFKAQAIVVLGGGIHPVAPEYENQACVNSSTLERLRYAAKLAKITKLPILVVGGNALEPNQPDEAGVMAKTLADEFGTTVRWQESRSRNTAENARFSYALLSKHNITHIVLVTHALHMPRAAKEFSASGFSLLPAPTGYLADNLPANIFSFLPSATAFSQSTKAIHEYLGDVWMQLKPKNNSQA